MPRKTLRPESPSGRPRILFAEIDPGFRMAAIDHLRDRFEVITVPAGVDPARLARAEAPEVVLLSISGSAEKSLRICRLLKSELEPPTVGLLNREGLRVSAAEVMEAGADGYLSGRADWEVFTRWVQALYAGERPVTELPREGLARRALRRLLG